MHIDVHERTPEHPTGYHQPCAICRQTPSRLRVLVWHPPRGPKGVPAWSVRASYYCEQHRREAERPA